MRRVIIESPYAGDIKGNTEYALEAMKDSLRSGEAPMASHILYAASGVLNEEDLMQREWGMAAGYAWMEKADLVAVYTDRGISPGMQRAVERAKLYNVDVVYRTIQR